MKTSIHAKCAGILRDGARTFVCGKSLYHVSPQCYDPGADRYFTADTRRTGPDERKR